MHLHDAVGDGQAQTGALADLLGGEKWFKYFGSVFRRDPGACVPHRNANCLGRVAGGNLQLAALRHGGIGVADQVG